MDTTVVFYSETKHNRPWIGLFIELLVVDDNMKVKVEWLKKERNNYVIHRADDGTPYYSVLECETIMFCDVLNNISPISDRTGPYAIDRDTKKQIMDAYNERDNNFNQ